MFSTKHNECVGFDSRWKVTKVSMNSGTQTTEFSTSDKGTSLINKSNIEAQTDTESVQSEEDADMEKLAAWLSKLYPKVENELIKAGNSKVFKDYKLADDLIDAKCELLQKITVTTSGNENDDALRRISAITWNSTGKILAVTCNYEHKTWCCHTGKVFFYTLDRENKLQSVVQKNLTTDSCITALQYHPSITAILVAGTFSGELYIWNTDLQQGDNILVKVHGHSGTVTGLLWTNDIDSEKVLVSSGIDGQLRMWSFSNGIYIYLIIKKTFKIKSPVLSRDQRILEPPEGISNKIIRGVLSFDFSKLIPDLFVVGVEGGLVVQCSLLGTSTLKGSTQEEPILDPIFKYYEPHEGEIISIRLSPDRKDMFLSCGTDGEIRIYILGQTEPAQVLYLKNTINSLTWICNESKLIAACGSSGLLEIFNVINGKPFEDITKEKIEKTVLTQLTLNNMKSNLLVIGCISGDLQLWNVPWNAFSSSDI